MVSPPDPVVRAKVVDAGADLAELQSALRGAVGRVTRARRGVAEELLLRVRPTGAEPSDEWRIGSQGSDWVLATPSDVLAGAYASPVAVDSALADLEGRDVARLDVTETLALVVAFGDGGWLEIQGLTADSDDDADDPPYWEVFTPSHELLRAGPGPIWVRSMISSSEGVQRGREQTRRPDFRALPDDELFKLWSQLAAELRRRGVTRHPAQVGDLAEELVRKHFGGFRGSYAQAGWDVLTPDGERIEVKAFSRRPQARPPDLIMRASNHDFDALVVVIFGADFAPVDAWHIPRDVVLSHLAGPRNSRGHVRVRLKDLLRAPAVRRLDL